MTTEDLLKALGRYTEDSHESDRQTATKLGAVLALRDEISLDGQQDLALTDLFRSIRVFGKWM
jgi:hypothetical protein